jgi:hypothetical protein
MIHRLRDAGRSISHVCYLRHNNPGELGPEIQKLQFPGDYSGLLGHRLIQGLKLEEFMEGTA